MDCKDIRYRCVYELIDPRSGEVFYIGQTCRPEARLSEHIDSAFGVFEAVSQEEYYLVSDKEYRIAEIKRECNKNPEMKIILEGQYTHSEICKLETQVINDFISRGFLLTNTNYIMREKERIAQNKLCESFLDEWHKKYSSMEDWQKQKHN